MIDFTARIETCKGDVRRVKVPKLGSQHFNREKFRENPAFRDCVNAVTFEPLVRRKARERGLGPYIDLDAPPRGVTIRVIGKGYMAKVTIEEL